MSRLHIAQRQIEASNVPEEEKNKLYQESAQLIDGWSGYDPSEYRWNVTPLDDDTTCRDCFEWRRYPVGQRHFGFSWWLVCNLFTAGNICTHAHHKEEIWMA